VPGLDITILLYLVSSLLILVLLLQVLHGWRLSVRLARLEAGLRQIAADDERTERSLREEFSRNRLESADQLRDNREELNNGLRRFGDQLSGQLALLTQRNGEELEKLRGVIESKLASLQKDNGDRLDQIRQTVDEKLHNTLEQRLGESFKLVSERLEQVHRGLGEMQNLAAGVGDLKKVLSNVKVRGTWGEVQLEQLLEQVLTPDQFAKNVAPKPNSAERVEFAIRLPGRDLDNTPVWLPIDAKFPLEDYQSLLEAQEAGDLPGLEAAGKALEIRIRNEAKSIRDKYIEPPYTTDFGLLFLPIESLYAEVLRRPGLSDALQRDYRVTVAGPTTLAAMLNSLQMGFRSLAIEKRSSEVWAILGAVKTEFGKFGDVLAKTKKKLDEARSTIEQAETRTRQIGRKLTSVVELPNDSAQSLLGDITTTQEPEDLHSNGL
jgi:DNA recombination protein RmuC